MKNHWNATLKRKVNTGTLKNRYLKEGMGLQALLDILPAYTPPPLSADPDEEEEGAGVDVAAAVAAAGAAGAAAGGLGELSAQVQAAAAAGGVSGGFCSSLGLRVRVAGRLVCVAVLLSVGSRTALPR